MDLKAQYERDRVQAVEDLWIVGSDTDSVFDRIARLVRAALSFPIAYVSLIDGARQHLQNRIDVQVCDGTREHAICDVTIRTDRELIVPDLRLDERFRDFPQVRDDPHLRSYWGVPLVTRRGFRVGALCAMDYVPRHAGPGDIEILRDFGRVATECLEMRALATTDLLTGVQTRRALLAEGERLFASRNPERQAMSCIFIDLDHFKTINDTLGHVAGDETLRHVGALLRAELRPDTLLGRMGGEEFVVLLPGEGIESAYAIAERLRHALKRAPGSLVALTASFGVSERLSEDGSLSDMIRHADEAVYAAKASGRNCTRPVGAASATTPHVLHGARGAQ